MKRRLAGIVAALMLGGCALINGDPVPDGSDRLVTANRLLSFADIYLTATPAARMTFFEAVEEDYTRNPSTENTLRMAILLILPENPEHNTERALNLLESVQEKPWSVAPGTLYLIRMLRGLALTLDECEQTRRENARALEESKKEIGSLREKINALTAIEQTVESPIETQNAEQQ